MLINMLFFLYWGACPIDSSTVQTPPPIDSSTFCISQPPPPIDSSTGGFFLGAEGPGPAWEAGGKSKGPGERALG